MKLLLLTILTISTHSSFALDFQKDIVDKLDSLIVADSKGPKYQELITDDAEQIIADEELDKVLDNGIELEDCDISEKILDKYEDVVDQDYIGVVHRFSSIKKKKKSRTIAYIVESSYLSVVTLELTDGSEVAVDCNAPLGAFYYENTKDKSVKYLGRD